MSAMAPTAVQVAPDIPVLYRVVERIEEVPDVVTLRVQPAFGRLPPFLPAQFSMIGVLGVGEVPISISSAVEDRTAHNYTIRRAGAVTSALVDRSIGSVITVRGPFGRAWDLQRADRRHAVFVAGGIGLAPLRAAIEGVTRGGLGLADRVSVLVGSATPEQQIYDDWLTALSRDGVDVRRSVDGGNQSTEWDGHVGLVTDLIPQIIEGPDVDAFVCGPDRMMTATIAALRHVGVAPENIEVTLERNMQCGNGWCGHCQLGPFLLCRDGPVLRATELGDLLERPEL